MDSLRPQLICLLVFTTYLTHTTGAYQLTNNENFVDYGLNREKLLESPEYSFGIHGASVGLTHKENYDPNYDPYSRVIVGQNNRVYYEAVKYDSNKLKLNQKLYKKHSFRRKRTKRFRRRPKKCVHSHKLKELGHQVTHETVPHNRKASKIAFISKPLDLKSFVKILKSAKKEKAI